MLHDLSILSIDNQWARSRGISPGIHRYLLRLGDVQKEMVVPALAHQLLRGTVVWVFTRCDEAGQ